jgi:hypothetical protein
MALGFTYSSGGGDFVAILKYDARAGRFFRVDRVQENGNYVSNQVDVTSGFKAIFDFENLEVGYISFPVGSAPDFTLVPLGEPYPQRPSDKHLQGVRFMLKLSKDSAGTGESIRECAATSAAFRSGIDELHDAYEAQKGANAGKLPIVALKTTVPVTSGQGAKKSTNYQPSFEIVGWAPRPDDLVFVPKARTQQVAQQPSPSAAPATGSTPVGAPAPKQMADAESDFG